FLQRPEITFLEDSENYAPPTPMFIDGAPKPAAGRTKIYELDVSARSAPKLSNVAEVWDPSCRDCSGANPSSCCKGQQKYDNNCAHFLSDALIRAGFHELVTDPKLYKCDKSTCKVPTDRRPIRAREMWEWFKRKAQLKHEKIKWDQIPKNSGWWAVFQ